MVGTSHSRRLLRVVLAAEESAGAQVLRAVLERGHELVAVVSGGRGSGLGASVAEQAQRHGLEVRPPSDLRSPDFADLLRARDVDVLLNVHSLVIATGPVVEAARHGSFNLHPGPLPHYAGLNVPSWALLHGEPRHGVTLHRMTVTVDAGPIAYATHFDLQEHDTALTVFSTCVREGGLLVQQLLDTLEQGRPVPEHRQDPELRRWFPPGPPDDGLLHWDRTAREVVAFVRACDYGPFPSPWGHPRSDLPGGEVEVLRARASGPCVPTPAGTVGARTPRGVEVATQDRWVVVEQLSRGGVRVEPGDVLEQGSVLRAGVPTPRTEAQADSARPGVGPAAPVRR